MEYPTNKSFFSLVNDGPTLDCRQKNLLEELNLRGQILPIISPLPAMSRLQQDYGEINKRLDVVRQKSLHYLKNALKAGVFFHGGIRYPI